MMIGFRKPRFLIFALIFIHVLPPGISRAQNGAPQATTPRAVYAVPRRENRARWLREGRRAVAQARRQRLIARRARNVILFVGDGMGVATVTAARILEGQRRGESGEENLLSFERFPNVALSKTYSTNQQTPDSAPTMTAIITGVKTKDGVISVDQNVTPGDHTTVEGNELPSLLAHAERRGLATGVVTTARLTHATPAACYAHTPERDWESDSDLSPEARADDFPDIARQLLEFDHGDGLEVALGGGRGKFMPRETVDPEDANSRGERADKRDLTREWTRSRRNAAYVWNKGDFDRINPRRTSRLLGLFERSHMKYEHDRGTDAGGEPSLAEMTTKAIDVLRKNRRGYVLVVEGGRIDHAHHDGNAYRALTDTIALSDAVRAAVGKANLRDTLVVVTADHSHAFAIAGYPTRGNPVLGLVRQNNSEGEPASSYARDRDGKPYTTLGYLNGPGAPVTATGAPAVPRPDLSTTDTTAPDYKQQALIPFGAETHGGEDVAVYADGAASHLIRGVIEQHVIFHVMRDALGFNRPRHRR